MKHRLAFLLTTDLLLSAVAYTEENLRDEDRAIAQVETARAAVEDRARKEF